VLALNSGSSSLKFGLYRVESFIPKMLLSGEAESIGGREGKFWARDRNDNLLAAESADFGTQQDAVTRVGRFLADCRETQPVAVGLTPTDGVIMGTRSGDLDPGVLVYLARQKNFDATRLEALVDHRSGLLGISGIDSDMRRLHEASPSSADARLAIQMFCYSIRKQVAAMIAALDGIDLLVFTGGIGEHDAKVRALICDRLSWLGIRLDPARSQSLQDPISDPASRCLVRVLPSKEDAEIAAHIGELVGC
jgi:acetate kinase